MRTVVLPGTGLAPSRLAFGSAALMARLTLRESVRLLDVAHDSGITHFDTARSYGYGEAESALGEFLSRRRDGVTVTTKLGIVPPRRSRTLQGAKTLARAVATRAPALRPLLRRRAAAMGQAGRFSPAEARGSLDTSLRELRVDRVDILLLHECRPADLSTEGLLDFLERAVRDGKVGSFGVATDCESTRVILAEQSRYAGVVQLAHNAVDPELELLPALADTAVITHSAVGPALHPLAELMRDPARRERWSRALDVDCARPAVCGRLLLAYALQSNADGVVLFSSTDEDRIRANAAVVDGREFSADQVHAFARLAREAISDLRPESSSQSARG